jgi:glycosyltransferase involved in cell wall biosynthesis
LRKTEIDVVILTKNSGQTIEGCLDSVNKNVPIGNVIIIDGHSTDNTLEIIREFDEKNGNITLIQDEGTRGRARQLGLEKVRTEWFMFVDSDVVLCNQWFEKAKKFIENDVGAIWGIEIWSVIRSPTFLRLFLPITKKIFEIRGGTHDLLVRLEAIRGIQIPEELNYFEDAFIKEWINKRGYKTLAKYDPYCIHYRPSSVWTMKGGVDISSEAIRFGAFKKYPSLVLPYSFYAAYFLHQNLFLKGRKAVHYDNLSN